VTIVMKGKKGTGKSLVSEYFGSIFGDAYLPVANQHYILGNFNMHLSKCLFLFLDEAIWGGDKKAEGILKHLITSDVNMFEPKGIDSVAMKSYLNIMIASNEDWVVPATADERRFFALDVKMDLQGKEKRAYFNAIYEEMQNGGPAAMLHDLLEVDVDLDVLRDPPKTDMLNEQVWNLACRKNTNSGRRSSAGGICSVTTIQADRTFPKAAQTLWTVFGRIEPINMKFTRSLRTSANGST